MPNSTTILIRCRECRRDTNHRVHYVLSEGSTRGDDYHWSCVHHLAQCAGCDTVCYATETTTEDDWDPRTGDLVPSWRVYPAPEEGRRPVDTDDHVPRSVAATYREVIGALNMNLSLLTAIGLRTLIEAVCKERQIAGEDLRQRIDGLASTGHLSVRQAKTLHDLRFLGNYAAHEIGKPQPGELLAAMEIAESMLKSIYVVPQLAKRVTTGKPK